MIHTASPELAHSLGLGARPMARDFASTPREARETAPRGTAGGRHSHAAPSTTRVSPVPRAMLVSDEQDGTRHKHLLSAQSKVHTCTQPIKLSAR
jgi:hypothetical protein